MFTDVKTAWYDNNPETGRHLNDLQSTDSSLNSKSGVNSHHIVGLYNTKGIYFHNYNSMYLCACASESLSNSS